MNAYRCIQATDPELRSRVYRLRSQCYSADLHRDIEAAADAFDPQANCTSWLVVRSATNEPAGSIRACLCNWEEPIHDVPALHSHGDEIAETTQSKWRFVQSTHFVMKQDVREIVPMLMLFREVHNAAVESDARFIFTVVQPRTSYLGFYRRLGFKICSQPALHPDFNVPTVLLGVDLQSDAYVHAKRNPRFHIVFGPDSDSDRVGVGALEGNHCG